jgi:hypothetical protein
MALVQLVRYSRANPEPDFLFGPLELSALDEQGLVVSGEDLDGVSEVLSEVPGLIEVQA